MMRKLTCFPPYGKESQKTVILLDCPNVTLRGNNKVFLYALVQSNTKYAKYRRKTLTYAVDRWF